VPLICYQYRKFIYITFIIFAAFTFIGVISAANDGQFVRSVLGDNYVNMSLENIEAGDPVAVYKSGSNWGSFIGITINNLRVGMIAFVLGVFLGIGTLYIMFKNCIMLGSFQYFFYEKAFPFTFAAGFLEGFITRYSNIMPHWLSVSIIIITLSIISYYHYIFEN